VRISSPRQKLQRQILNIKRLYPTAIIIEEIFTGTKFEGRDALDKLIKIVEKNDTIVFDSVSRLSRSETGTELYKFLYYKQVNLIFLKEPHINTSVYREAIEKQIAIHVNTGDEATDSFINAILDALNAYAISLAEQQIRLAFRQAEKEVTDLQQRTKEGLATAKMNGKQLGRPMGAKVETKKSLRAKEIIRKRSKDFGGELSNDEILLLADISRNTLFKLKRQLRLEEKEV